MTRTKLISVLKYLDHPGQGVYEATTELEKEAAGGHIISVTSSVYGNIYILTAVVELEDSSKHEST